MTLRSTSAARLLIRPAPIMAAEPLMVCAILSAASASPSRSDSSRAAT